MFLFFEWLIVSVVYDKEKKTKLEEKKTKKQNRMIIFFNSLNKLERTEASKFKYLRMILNDLYRFERVVNYCVI